MNFTGESAALLVQKALVLEPLADKPGCTTRYSDLPGKPLESFVLAAINVGPVFKRFADERLSGDKRLFCHFVSALKVSNHHVSGKYVNFGLLEIMFPTVAARLACDNPASVVPKIVELMKNAPASDAKEMVRARELAWSTSSQREAKLIDLSAEARAAPSPYGFYECLVAGSPHGSAEQWVANYRQGLPLLADQFDDMRRQTDGALSDRIANAYIRVQEKNPDIRVGILADMSAAAIFLYMSFMETE